MTGFSLLPYILLLFTPEVRRLDVEKVTVNLEGGSRKVRPVSDGGRTAWHVLCIIFGINVCAQACAREKAIWVR